MNDATWIALMVTFITVAVAEVGRLIRISDAALFRACVSVFISAGDLVLSHDANGAAIWLAVAGWNVWLWWHHRNDDDDDIRRRRRRLRAWAKSKLPRPVARVLRNPA